MEIDLILGIGCIAVAIVLYGASFLQYKRKNYYRSLLLIVLTGLMLRVFCSLDPMLHKWDERYHALVAKNLIESPLEPKLYHETVFEFEYKNWTANEVWLHKQPLALWTMALSMRIFGVDAFSLRIPSILLSTLCILLTFFIGKHLYSEKIGLFAAAFHSINGLIIELAAGRVATDHVDTFFLFFIELSLFFIISETVSSKRWHIVLAGIACGLAILTKWLPAMIIFPLYIILNSNKDKSLWQITGELAILTASALFVAGPWQLYAFTHFPIEYLWEQHFNNLHFTQSLEGHGQPWYFFVNRIRITVNEAIYLALLWFIYFTVKQKRMPVNNLLIGAWILIPLIVFSVATSKMQGYLLFTFPAYFIVLALFAENLMQEYPNSDSRVIPFVRTFLAITLFGLAFRYGLERIKPLGQHASERAAKRELTSTGFPPNAILFNMPCPVEAMFYSGGIAYAHIPDPETMDRLISEKYDLYVVDDENLSEQIRQSPLIRKIKMPGVLTMCR